MGDGEEKEKKKEKKKRNNIHAGVFEAPASVSDECAQVELREA